jgi:hypothetical protein
MKLRGVIRQIPGAESAPENRPGERAITPVIRQTPIYKTRPLVGAKKALVQSQKKSPKIKDLEAEIWWVVLDSNQRPIG